ncbi:CpaD family pilus assembly protein [Sphingomonadaceae bacterium jetA1]|jgi:pilus assembly protein CpaD|uniref:CpaD family pilus assembly protein n=1 Tax=Facivitalis istanbulensis TaxID=3075838 RepID=UPI0034915510
MRCSLLPLAPIGLLLATGGCAGAGQTGLETVHQPVVAQTEYALDLAVSGGRLAADEGQRLDGWARNLRLGYGDRVTVEDPAGEAPRAWREVADVMGRYGLLIGQSGSVPRSPVAPATVRVVVMRAKASVPGCPDWRSEGLPDWDGRGASNHGCAVNRNLAAMVANPTDLVRGVEGPSASDPAMATRAIDALRQATPTGNGGTTLRSANASGGNGGMGGRQ